jgi:predicted nucleic acid-binding protein
MIVVADTGPVLHLFWVGALSWALPPQPIDVVRPVWEEVRAHAPDALQDTRLRVVDPPTVVAPPLARWTLDAGESAALSYALAHQDTETVLVLCDEQEARSACSALSLPVVGSIGLIIEAFRAGRVSMQTATAALRDLPGPGRLHVRPELISLALAALTEST